MTIQKEFLWHREPTVSLCRTMGKTLGCLARQTLTKLGRSQQGREEASCWDLR